MMMDLSIGTAKLLIWENFLNQTEANSWYKHFNSTVQWRSEQVKVFGKFYDQPRLTALYADEEKSYTYAGLTLEAFSFTEKMKRLKNDIEYVTTYRYNSCLFNLYRNEKDSNGWHADDEPELGPQPVIASLSLGATRRFHLKHKMDKTLKRTIELRHGSLLLMAGTTQKDFKHQLPKTQTPKAPRINLTFRYIFEKI
jgi:alkylated DNA repair dioxygenase AlkB